MPAKSAAPRAPRPAAINPIVAAMLEKRTPSVSLGERALSATASAVANTTLVVGRLIESVDADRFSDGRKSQKFLNLKSRSDYWRKFGDEHGLTDEDVAAIIGN